ncbi:MAG: hypothetical protein U0R44_03990 [Candidatus Micrarchaeia archaeon]
MRRLEHSQNIHDAERPKRLFSKVADRFKELMRPALIAMMVAAGPLTVTVPRTANADVNAVDTREINGRRLNVVRLENTLAQIDNDTIQYREPEVLPTDANGNVYRNSVRIPNEVSFLVTLDPANNLRRMSVRFPRTRESDPNAPNAGLRGMDLNNFAAYVRQVSGRDMVRVKFYVETGTFTYNGRQTTYTNAYVMPLDASGNVLTYRGNREYIMYGATYYADFAGGDPQLIVDALPAPGRVARR